MSFQNTTSVETSLSDFHKMTFTIMKTFFKKKNRDWRNKDERSPLRRHSEVYHRGEDFDLEVKITDKSFGKPSRRMISR